jgi:hypothetical protein
MSRPLPDADATRALWDTLCARYNTRVTHREHAPQMRLTGHLLGLSGFMDRHTFMTRYTTVWGRHIFPCFHVGEGEPEELWRQIVVCVHEHQHVEQFDRDGFIPYAARYLASSRQRALYEAEAYCCNLELHFWRTGQLVDLDELAARLGPYGCSKADQRAARAVFAACADALQRGHYTTRATCHALPLLDALLPAA